MNFAEAGGFVRGIDEWIERPIECGNGHAPKPDKLRCTGCDWSGPFNDAAIEHYAATGHELTYRGVVQDIANLVKR